MASTACATRRLLVRSMRSWVLKELTDSLGLAMKLVANHRVAVAPGMAFGAAGEGFLRVCFAQSTERMERAMQRLRDGIRVEMAG